MLPGHWKPGWVKVCKHLMVLWPRGKFVPSWPSSELNYLGPYSSEPVELPHKKVHLFIGHHARRGHTSGGTLGVRVAQKRGGTPKKAAERAPKKPWRSGCHAKKDDRRGVVRRTTGAGRPSSTPRSGGSRNASESPLSERWWFGGGFVSGGVFHSRYILK